MLIKYALTILCFCLCLAGCSSATSTPEMTESTEAVTVETTPVEVYNWEDETTMTFLPATNKFFIDADKSTNKFNFPIPTLDKSVRGLTGYGIKKTYNEKVNIITKDASETLPDPVTTSYSSKIGKSVLEDTGEEINFFRKGSLYKYGYHYTWYSSNQQEHWRVDEWIACDDGFYRTTDGYIVVACREFPKNTIIKTPFGKAKVLDFCEKRHWVDIYTWY